MISTTGRSNHKWWLRFLSSRIFAPRWCFHPQSWSQLLGQVSASGQLDYGDSIWEFAWPSIYTSSSSIWTKLERIVVSSSKLKIVQLRGQLETIKIKKGSTSIDDYLKTIRNLAKQLASMSSPVFDTNLFYFSLGGLGPEYKSFITLVSSQAEDLPFEYLSSLLCSHEVCISSLHLDVPSVIALTATKPSTSSPNRSPYQQPSSRGRRRGHAHASFPGQSFPQG